MLSSSYLKNRNGHYHLRLRIPSDLSPLLPYQTEIVKSLKTSNLKTARASSFQYMQGITQTFSLLRCSYITPRQAEERLESILEYKLRDTKAKAHRANMDAVEASPILSKSVTTYISDKAEEWSAKTMMEMTGIFKLLIDLLGDVPIDSIDRTTVRTLRDNLQKLTPNVYKVHPKLTPLEVLKQIDSGILLPSPPMSLTSVNKHISKFSTLMLYCIKEGHRKDNPASGLNIKQKRRQDEERKAYDAEDIKRISQHLPKDKSKAERLWVPLICMLSGMRLDEACQLYKEDIIKVNAVWCFDVNDCKDKKLKNLSSKRIIPVHPSLIDMGLLVYVAQCAEGERLWSNLKWCKVNGYSNSLGKWYQRFNRQYITQDKFKTFHSLRHSFADGLKQQGIQKELIMELMGHSDNSMTMGRYGKRFKAEVLLEVIQKVDYDILPSSIFCGNSAIKGGQNA